MTYRLERKEDALSVGYDAFIQSTVGPRLVWDKEEFINTWDFSDVFAITKDGKTIGCVFFHHETFLHIAILPEHRGKWARQVWPDILDYVVEVYGSVIGIVHVDNEETNSQMERAGFEFYKTEDEHNWWSL